MRDIGAELDRLREKLRRLEQRTASKQIDGLSEPGNEGEHERPPWETSVAEDRFEISLLQTGERHSTAQDHSPWQVGTPGRPSRIEDCVTGKLVESAQGVYFQAETLYPFAQVHGNFAVAGLDGLPGSLIDALCPENGSAAPGTWAFLDTETIGLAGGAGSFAFLIGLGFVTESGFLVRQYFLREPAEEPSVLGALAADLDHFRTLITYNGRSFDAPLLETRYRLARQPVPFAEMPHLDLLFACRRLWKLRFDSCKLTGLERDVLGFERIGDVPGFLIPSLYTNYLRTGEAGSLAPVFTHNALDILSLACLTSMVAAVFENPERARQRHPAECLGLGRWLLQLGRKEEAVRFLWRAADRVIPEDQLARALWDIAVAERQLGRHQNAVKPLEQLLSFPNRFQTRALETLSIAYERRLFDLPLALKYARQLEGREPGESAAARVERLVKKLRKRSHQRFLG